MFTEPEINPRQNNPAMGIFLMLSAWCLFALVDTSAKWLVLTSISTVQVVFMRYAVQFGCTLLGAAGPFAVTRKMDRKTFLLLSFRATLLVVCTFFNFIAIKYLPLTMTSAIMFSSPIIVAAISMVYLRELVDICEEVEKPLKVHQGILDNQDIIEQNYKMMQLYSPLISVQGKQKVKYALNNFKFQFNKTEVDKMMVFDGFGTVNFNDLYAIFRRICVDN